jgi:hypothetical protein
MTNTETPERFAVRVKAARISMKADRLLGQPSPDWILGLVEEGERRERAQREADSSSH